MRTRLPIPIASAPPLPPSPVTTARTGVRRAAISRRFRAIASAWPRSSAPTPGYAPGVSMRLRTGLPDFELRDLLAAAGRVVLGLERRDPVLQLEQGLLEIKRVRHTPP